MRRARRNAYLPSFATEASLCSAFQAWATAQGLVVYPETAGWDLLLVQEDKAQIGVQAKLRLNAKVLCQAMLHPWGAETGPDYRAVLIPTRGGDMEQIASYLGLALIRPRQQLGSEPITFDMPRAMVDWNPVSRHDLPAIVPDVQAGIPSPIQLTEWKIKALRVLARMDAQGYITRAQIRNMGVDPQRWCQYWLDPIGEGRYVRSPSLPRFDRQHPAVFAQIAAEEAQSAAQATTKPFELT